jgi:hypothetical protein
MKKMYCFLFVVLFVVLASGCGSVMIVKVKDGDSGVEGLRFNRPVPYLVISKNIANDSGLTYQIVYLPNKKEEYAIQTKAGMGNVDNKYTLKDGWQLTQFDDKRESKGIETLTWLTSLLAAPATTKGIPIEGLNPARVNKPGLYVFEYDDNGLISGVKQILEF